MSKAFCRSREGQEVACVFIRIYARYKPNIAERFCLGALPFSKSMLAIENKIISLRCSMIWLWTTLSSNLKNVGRFDIGRQFVGSCSSPFLYLG